jgi:hypothetical protein
LASPAGTRRAASHCRLHVDDRLVAIPIERGKPLRPALVPVDHRDVERGALRWVLAEPGPEVGAERCGKRRPASDCVKLARCSVPSPTEEMRERALTRGTEELGDRSVPEHSGVGLLEHSVARERAQEPMQHVRVGADGFGQIADGDRPVRAPATSRSATWARARVTARREGNPRALTPASALMRAFVPRRPRLPPSRRGYGSPAAAGRRGARPPRPGRLPQLGRELLLHRAGELGSSLSGSAPPPTRPTVSSTSPPTARASRPPAHALPRAARAACGARALAQRPHRVEVEPERPLQRCERELVRARARCSGRPPQRPTSSARPDDDPGLGAAEELVAGEADGSAPAARLSPRRLVLEILRTPEPRSSTSGSRWRCATAARSATDGCSVKPTTEVRLVDAQEHGRLRADCPLVVGGASDSSCPPLAAAHRSARARPGS